MLNLERVRKEAAGWSMFGMVLAAAAVALVALSPLTVKYARRRRRVDELIRRAAAEAEKNRDVEEESN